ncbi:MAG: hypothetical protein KBD64_02825 [Gammaproteobacteria bacterium]|nr:hypothetical protein [Gammaproteobacteria bacterium]
MQQTQQDKLYINELGRIEIIDDQLLAELLREDELPDRAVTNYLNFTCNGNFSYY